MPAVTVVRAWPRTFETIALDLPAGACVRDALSAAGLAPDAACAVHGVRVAADAPLADGDRVEVLRPLLIDPKEARRRRVAARRNPEPR